MQSEPRLDRTVNRAAAGDKPQRRRRNLVEILRKKR
jgi:hypothetical protein